MDDFYRGVETSLLGLGLALALAATAFVVLPNAAPAGQTSITLPMIEVIAESPARPR